MAGIDTRVQALLTDVLSCLTGECVDAGAPPCWMGTYPGSAAIMDNCGCGDDGDGQGFVRLVEVFPSQVFPQVDVAPRPPAEVQWAATIEVGLYRPITVTTSLSEDDALADTTRQVADMGILLRTLACCPAIAGRGKHLIGRYTPVTNGDCGGGTIQVTVRL